MAHYVYALAVSGTNLFAGTSQGGVWRRPLSEMITDVDPVASGLPHEFSLQQNYPNPFNPTTEIRYQTPEVSHVMLKVFDILGREVATLVDGIEEPGYHNVQWSTDNGQLSSGVYFYRLTADPSIRSGHGFVDVKKLLFLK